MSDNTNHFKVPVAKPCPMCGQVPTVYMPDNWAVYPVLSDDMYIIKHPPLDIIALVSESASNKLNLCVLAGISMTLGRWNKRPCEDAIQAELDTYTKWHDYPQEHPELPTDVPFAKTRVSVRVWGEYNMEYEHDDGEVFEVKLIDTVTYSIDRNLPDSPPMITNRNGEKVTLLRWRYIPL